MQWVDADISEVNVRFIRYGGSVSQDWVIWNIAQKRVCLVVIVHVATIMLKTVTDDEIFYLHDYVVAAYLVEDLLRDVDVWGFVLDNHSRTELLRI